ncbi:MAG: M14 family zinc carboxypeptidase [Ignavibacteriaceae bacterium]
MIFINRLTLFLLYLTLILNFNLNAQQALSPLEGVRAEFDKCGFYFDDELNLYDKSINNWGYSYDSLLTDLDDWRESPFVKINSIGLSVQGRPLWRMTISDDPESPGDKRTIHIHARTHPQETEGFWVTKEMINILLSQSALAQELRNKYVYYIIPMFNPDGVELNLPRRNANNVDLESNWNTFPHQPEVQALKAHFISLMESDNPIEVMLNMHSSSLCKRYFVYHDSVGTSSAFALLQQDFINGIRYYFPNGIEPWNYFVSWTSGTPLQYPESWFWTNHSENVMALTYEDMYQCAGTGNFDITANALLMGVKDYMESLTDVKVFTDNSPGQFGLFQNYPNPFNPVTTIRYQLNVNSNVNIKIYDVLGKEIAALVDEEKPAGVYEVQFNPEDISSGIYFYTINSDDIYQTRKMIYQK